MNKKIIYYQFKNNIEKDENKKGPIKIFEENKNKKTPNLNNSFSKEFTNISEDLYDDDEDDNLLSQSYSFSQISKIKEEFLKEPLNIILDSYIYGKNYKKRKIKFITSKDISNFNNNKLLSNQLNKNKEIEEYLQIRKNLNEENKFEEILKKLLDGEKLQILYETILKVNYRLNVNNPNNNVSPILTLEHLFDVILKNQLNQNLNVNNSDLNNKYDKLKPIIYRYRQIKGDGNCYYRAIMFRYLEKLILQGNTILLKKIILDMEKCFKSQEIKSRIKIKMDTIFNSELQLKIMILILRLIEKGKIKDAHELFVKSILSCSKFDYGLILYFRYIIYLYIKENENKLFSKNFPIKVGNLLPSIYENQKGEFEFCKFYTNYLLKMFMEAEKIIIYLTPFILKINLDIIIFEDNEEQVVKRLSYEDNNSEIFENDNVITLLNRNAHYEIVYTSDEYNKYSSIYNLYTVFEKNKDLEENDFFLLETNRNKNNDFDRNSSYSLNYKLKNIDNNIKSKVIVYKNNINSSNNNKEMKNNINQQIDNFQNKDNNESYDNNLIENKELKRKKEMENISLNEIPIGHPKLIPDDNYLNIIDNLFSYPINNSCIKCKNKIKISIEDKYNLCNKCLKNEILFLLRKDYSDYLSLGNFTKKFTIKKVEINKYYLYLKDIIDILNIKDEKEIINNLKSNVCLNCLKIVDNKNSYNINLPCKCFICDKGELWNYFTVQNEISDNFTCICGYKYEPKDLYNLGIECNKIGNFELILLLINIFNKSILTKGCCVCGKNGKQEKIEYEPENKSSFCFENYLKLHKYNINLDHTMCKECKKKFKNQMFFCHYCNRNHLFISK